MNAENPYASPTTPVGHNAISQINQETLGAIAKSTFIAWEKLRIAYIAILVVVTLATSLIQPRVLLTFEFWSTAVFGAIVVNVCFFLGPILDTYISWLGFRSKWLRWTMFVFGTLISMIVAVVAIVLLIAKLELTGVSIS